MKTAKEFLEEYQQNYNKKNGTHMDYLRMLSYEAAMTLYADYATESLVQEINDQEKLLICFMTHLRQKGIAFNKDYSQEDLERIAYVFLLEDETEQSDDDNYTISSGDSIPYDDNKC